MAESLGQIPFGKHKGMDIEDIPNDYLKWISGEYSFRIKHPELYKAIQKELKFRGMFPDS